MDALTEGRCVKITREECPLARSFPSSELCSGQTSQNALTPANTTQYSDDDDSDGADDYAAMRAFSCRSASMEFYPSSAVFDETTNTAPCTHAEIPPATKPVEGATAELNEKRRPEGKALSYAEGPAGLLSRRTVAPVMTRNTVVFNVPSPKQRRISELKQLRGVTVHVCGAADTTSSVPPAAQHHKAAEEREQCASPLSLRPLPTFGATPFTCHAAADTQTDVVSLKASQRGTTWSDGSCGDASTTAGSPHSLCNSAVTFVDYCADDASALEGSFLSATDVELSGAAGDQPVRRDTAQLADARKTAVKVRPGTFYTTEYSIAVSEAAKYRWSTREILSARATVDVNEEEEMDSEEDI